MSTLPAPEAGAGPLTGSELPGPGVVPAAPTSATPPEDAGDKDGAGRTLALLCRGTPAEAGAILRLDPAAGVQVLALHPAPASLPPTIASWLEQAGRLVLEPSPASEGQATRAFDSPDDMYGQPPTRHLVAVPLARGGACSSERAVFLVRAPDTRALTATQERLALVAPVLELQDLRRESARLALSDLRLSAAVETASSMNLRDGLRPAAMSLCNEIAVRWSCERVSLGMLSGRYVKLRGMSQAEDFSRKAELVSALESAMEECLDQDLEVVHPAPPESSAIERAAAELSAKHGPACICSLPLRGGGEARAVVTVERPGERPFTDDEIRSLRLTLELVTPALLCVAATDGWLGARASRLARDAAVAAVGPRHTGARLSALAAAGLLLFVLFGHGAHRVDAPFVLKADRHRVVPAPFDGYLKEALASPGDEVKGDTTVLARLDTAELDLQLAAAKAEEASYLKEASARLSRGERAEEQIARAEARKLGARLELCRRHIAQATLVAPISGTVVGEDLQQRLGAPVRQGEVLFEVAALDSLYAQAFVPEEEIGYLRVGQAGTIAAASFPSRAIPVVVDRIHPSGEALDQRNVFQVRLRLESKEDWLRPGMEGAAKLTVGERPYWWLWLHPVLDWLYLRVLP
ncbi:MAG: HlyD family efflux transporter periplasmic adaptor subunit [Planctomycetes bacterium]|nr:HlyD family efflux transporter periplasmic adaptor subunit [Planctomycetota bacterium]